MLVHRDSIASDALRYDKPRVRNRIILNSMIQKLTANVKRYAGARQSFRLPAAGVK